MKYLLTAVLALVAGSAPAAQFRGILATDISPAGFGVPVVNVTTISGDGSTLGGTMNLTGVIFDCAVFGCGTSGFVWTHGEASRRDLGTLPLNSPWVGSPRAVPALSFDGSIALATYEARHYESAMHQNGVVTPLRNPIVAGEWLNASGMTPDGNIVVGTLNNTPFHWNATTGAIYGFAGVSAVSGYAPAAISSDGSTTVFNSDGYIITETLPISIDPGIIITEAEPFPRIAMQWTSSEGPRELLPVEGFSSSRANAISADGSVVVGTSFIDGVFPTPPDRATVWENGQPTLLPAIAQYSTAMDVSADGSIIVGLVGYGSGIHLAEDAPYGAAVWIDGTARFITELLTTEYGLGDELEGWRLTSATAISDDGTVIAGNGFAPDGTSAAWVVVLPVPEPASVVLALVGVMGAVALRRKK